MLEMRSAVSIAACMVGGFLTNSSLGFAPSPHLCQRSWFDRSTCLTRNMFSGSGSPLEEYDPDREKQIEQASKAMGFSVQEYKLVMKMQAQLADSVNSIRATGGSADKGVTIELDGNSPANHVEVTITDAGKALGKEGLEKEIKVALKAASEAAKKGQQQAIQKMNQDIAGELKKLGK